MVPRRVFVPGAAPARAGPGWLSVGTALPPTGGGTAGFPKLLEELLTEELLEGETEELLDEEPDGPVMAAAFRLGIAPKESVNVDR